MVKSLSILGSTGSIGTQSLNVAKNCNIKVKALSAMRNIDLLEKQAREFNPEYVCVVDEGLAGQLKTALADTDTKVISGKSGLLFIAAEVDADILLNSVVGMAGLVPTLSAIKAGRNIALANKETLVTGGALVTSEAKKHNVKILPVDSEHSAIFQCLETMHRKEDLKSIILTASGGPFFGKGYSELMNITKADALNHPNWSMGAKITVDSATMMNKGLELIEAVWLFDVKPSDVQVVIHRESVIHSMIEYNDNAVIAQLGVPDMAIPIQYALTYPERYPSPAKRLSLTEFSKLTFFEPDYDTFTCLKLAKSAIERGGTAPAILNGANEEAVRLFLNDRISFLKISELAEEALDSCTVTEISSLNSVLEADKTAREFVLSHV